MFGIGFIGGVASYRDECVRKLMALENSVLAKSYRDFLEKYVSLRPSRHLSAQS